MARDKLLPTAFGPQLPSRTLRAHRIRKGRLSTKQFNKALSDWSLKAVPADIAKVTQWFAFEALRRIVKRTPADTGRARGGWHVTIGSPSSSATGNKDDSGKTTISSGKATITSAKPYQVIWISNNVEYIRILEEGGFVPTDPGKSKTGGSASKAGRKARKGKILVKGGYSVQAPQGMVGVTMQELMTKGVIK